MALIEEKIIKEVRLEKEADQVRLVVDNVVTRDGVEILRTTGNEVYTQESKEQLELVENGSSYVALMGW